jgi:hypothetical protein
MIQLLAWLLALLTTASMPTDVRRILDDARHAEAFEIRHGVLAMLDVEPIGVAARPIPSRPREADGELFRFHAPHPGRFSGVRLTLIDLTGRNGRLSPRQSHVAELIGNPAAGLTLWEHTPAAASRDRVEADALVVLWDVGINWNGVRLDAAAGAA